MHVFNAVRKRLAMDDYWITVGSTKYTDGKNKGGARVLIEGERPPKGQKHTGKIIGGIAGKANGKTVGEFIASAKEARTGATSKGGSGAGQQAGTGNTSQRGAQPGGVSGGHPANKTVMPASLGSQGVVFFGGGYRIQRFDAYGEYCYRVIRGHNDESAIYGGYNDQVYYGGYKTLSGAYKKIKKLTGKEPQVISVENGEGEMFPDKSKGGGGTQPGGRAKPVTVDPPAEVNGGILGKLTSLGGNRWTKEIDGKTYDRMYFNLSAVKGKLDPSDVQSFKSSFGKIWYDFADNQFHVKGKTLSESTKDRILSEFNSLLAGSSAGAAPPGSGGGPEKGLKPEQRPEFGSGIFKETSRTIEGAKKLGEAEAASLLNRISEQRPDGRITEKTIYDYKDAVMNELNSKAQKLKELEAQAGAGDRLKLARLKDQFQAYQAAVQEAMKYKYYDPDSRGAYQALKGVSQKLFQSLKELFIHGQLSDSFRSRFRKDESGMGFADRFVTPSPTDNTAGGFLMDFRARNGGLRNIDTDEKLEALSSRFRSELQQQAAKRGLSSLDTAVAQRVFAIFTEHKSREFAHEAGQRLPQSLKNLLSEVSQAFPEKYGLSDAGNRRASAVNAVEHTGLYHAITERQKKLLSNPEEIRSVHDLYEKSSQIAHSMTEAFVQKLEQGLSSLDAPRGSAERELQETLRRLPDRIRQTTLFANPFRGMQEIREAQSGINTVNWYLSQTDQYKKYGLSSALRNVQGAENALKRMQTLPLYARDPEYEARLAQQIARKKKYYERKASTGAHDSSPFRFNAARRYLSSMAKDSAARAPLFGAVRTLLARLIAQAA